jgi:hypothetical protein
MISRFQENYYCSESSHEDPLNYWIRVHKWVLNWVGNILEDDNLGSLVLAPSDACLSAKYWAHFRGVQGAVWFFLKKKKKPTTPSQEQRSRVLFYMCKFQLITFHINIMKQDFACCYCGLTSSNDIASRYKIVISSCNSMLAKLRYKYLYFIARFNSMEETHTCICISEQLLLISITRFIIHKRFISFVSCHFMAMETDRDMNPEAKIRMAWILYLDHRVI